MVRLTYHLGLRFQSLPKEQSVDVAVAVELIKDAHHSIPGPDYVDENVSTKVVRII